MTLIPIRTVILLMAIPLLGQNASSIRFAAHINGGKHRLTDLLPVEIRIENVGKEAVYLYPDLNYFITIFAATAKGESIPPEFIRETLGPPPKKGGLTRLEPGHFFGTVSFENIKGLGIKKPGIYRLDLEYRSILNSQAEDGLPVWRGHQSTTVNFVVSN